MLPFIPFVSLSRPRYTLGSFAEPALGRIALVTRLASRSPAPLPIRSHATGEPAVTRLICSLPLGGSDVTGLGLRTVCPFLALLL